MRRITLILFHLIICFSAYCQPKKPVVMVMEIKAEIDSRMTRYVSLALDHAKKIEANYVIVEMDTYGGVLTDAKDIVDLIMAFKKPIWVFVNSDAASAGALISIACDSIYMSHGASIGAATVVEGGSGNAAPDKYQSYMRSIMRATAEENGRDPRIAEGMVDERIVIDSIKQAGKVITFTTTEAIANGYCEAKVQSIAEILKRNNIANYKIEYFKLSYVERIVAFFLNPVISGLLILIIIGGIYFELQAPGIGFPAAAAIIALILYLVPYYLNGLATYWEIIMLFIGIVLLVAEIFIIPGFGIAGISGIILTVTSLILIMLNNDNFNFEYVPMRSLVMASLATIGGLAGGALLLFFGGAKLSNSRAFRKMTLTDTQSSSKGYSVNTQETSILGKQGIAHTILRPSGKVLIDQQVFDAFTQGDFIEKGENVEVISTEGVTLKVKRI